MFPIQNSNGLEKAAFTFMNLAFKKQTTQSSISTCLGDQFFMKLHS